MLLKDNSLPLRIRHLVQTMVFCPEGGLKSSIHLHHSSRHSSNVMRCFNSEAYHNTIPALVITAAISALMQSSYAAIETDDSYQTLDGRMPGEWQGIRAGDIFSAGRVWAQYAYSKATQDIKDKMPGYHTVTNGFSLGADNPLQKDQDIAVGIAYTCAQGKLTEKDRPGNKMTTDTHIFSLYSSYVEDNFFFAGRMRYVSGKNRSHRYISDTPQDGKYDTQSWGTNLIAGYTYPLEYQWRWQPSVTLNAYTINTDNKGGYARDPAQTFFPYAPVNHDKYRILELGAGLKLMGDINTGTMIIKPELGLAGFHDFKKNPVVINACFATGGASFLLNSADSDANRYQFDAALTVEIQGNTALTLSYWHHWADNFRMDGIIARARYDF